MVNLTIRLSKPGASPGVKQEHQPSATPVAPEGPSIPPHLADADLPLVRGIGFVDPEACDINFVGVKARRKPGDKVHICVRCNFPIAVYGRLDPCEHVYCLTCAKLDSTCFLCHERVVRIQKMDVLEGIFICGAPGCLRSFLARPDFEWHVANAHSQLLQPEPGKILEVENSPVVTQVLQAQVQSRPDGHRLLDFTPPARQSSGTLQVILPKKEEPQRKPPKALRQDQQGHMARPVPELRLPDQFPHQRSGVQVNHNGGLGLDPGEKGQKVHQRHKDWESQMQGQRDRENEQDQGHEGQSNRERGSDNGPQSARKRERDREHRGPHPPPHPSPKELQKQRDHSLQAQPNQQPVTLPPPPPYPPPNFSQAFPPQQEANGFPPRFETPRGFHPGMAMLPRPEYHDGFSQNGRPRPPPDGYGQNGPPRPMNGNPQDSFGQNGPPRPHFLGDFPSPMGMPPMGAPRFHEGHLPPPPPGPPPKRAKFSGHPGPGVALSGDQMMDYGWAPGNSGNFAGPPGGHIFPGWLPPANA